MSYTSKPSAQTIVLATTHTHAATTTNMEDVPGLALPMMASSLYEFEFSIIFQTSAANRGIGLGVNGPAGPAFVLTHTEIHTSLSATTTGMQRAYATGTATTAVDSANTNMYARVYGFASNGTTPGNLTLCYLCNNSGGVPSIRAGSVMRMWRVSPL